MNKLPPENIRDLRVYSDPETAVARLTEIYEDGCGLLRKHFERFAAGEQDLNKVDACYPYLSLEVSSIANDERGSLSYGNVSEPGRYGSTLTNPALFRGYYLEQIRLLMENHKATVEVGISNRQIPPESRSNSKLAKLLRKKI